MGNEGTDPSRALQLGLQLHQHGKLDQAETQYRAVLSAQPDQFDAMHLLGLLRFQQGRHGEALDCIGAALKLRPKSAAARSNLGLALAASGRLEEALASFDKALSLQPDFAEAHNNRGNVLLHLWRFGEALASFDKSLKLMPGNVEALNNRGKALLSLKRPADALASFDKALALRRDHTEALCNRGVALLGLKRPQEALATFDKVLALQPDLVEAVNGRGNALLGMKRPEEALASFDRALALRPDTAEALNNRGNALLELKWPGEALASFDRALVQRPDYAEALANRGIALGDLGRPEEALASLDMALGVNPDLPEVLNNRANRLMDLKRFSEALASFDKALKLKPAFAEALNGWGMALAHLNRPKEALACYDKALAIRPDYAAALHNRGNVFLALKRPGAALEIYNKALALEPDFPPALIGHGCALLDLKRPVEALAAFDKALAIEPNHANLLEGQLKASVSACCWIRAKEIADRLISERMWRQSAIFPFHLLGYCDDPSVHLDCAGHAIEEIAKASGSSFVPRGKSPPGPPGKLRIGYISADFRVHPTAGLISELIELHDRARFEVIGVSIGLDDRSEVRSRLARAFDRFFDVQHRSDQDNAQHLKNLEIDIAVDLMGHTRDGRPGILASRPVPIQVSYLGYPGTTGADFIDYVIADPVVLPFDQQLHYTERIVHLPHSYQANDSKKPVPSSLSIPTRQACGLPEDGLVFCCFNNNFKITQEIFDVWMRLLAAVPGSVLWLLRDNADAELNLRQAAHERGVDSGRLVFAQRLPYQEHLARHLQADLFLDTLPYNAHTTASDALWAGLPLLTCMGRSFASRVAASLLHAAGLPELVTRSLADYEALARHLAANPIVLREYKRRLQENRHTCRLFDTARFARHIEDAYMRMWQLYQRGEGPQSFSVSA